MARLNIYAMEIGQLWDYVEDLREQLAKVELRAELAEAHITGLVESLRKDED